MVLLEMTLTNSTITENVTKLRSAFSLVNSASHVILNCIFQVSPALLLLIVRTLWLALCAEIDAITWGLISAGIGSGNGSL